VVESNQHSVFVRGKTDQSIINLPEEWIGLVHADSVTVHLTPIGKFQGLFVVSQDNETIKVGGNDGYYGTINQTQGGENKPTVTPAVAPHSGMIRATTSYR
jgi:hypothetical protein